jgi:hypothetical protein
VREGVRERLEREREGVLGRQREAGRERMRDVAVSVVSWHMHLTWCGQRVSEAERRRWEGILRGRHMYMFIFIFIYK